MCEYNGEKFVLKNCFIYSVKISIPVPDRTIIVERQMDFSKNREVLGTL
jgi:hypothetical protein